MLIPLKSLLFLLGLLCFVSSALSQSLLLAPDGASFDRFGSDVAASNQYIAVGSFKDDDRGSSSGSVSIFDAGTKTFLYKVVPSDLAAGDEFGGALALHGNLLLVGAQFQDSATASNTGAAYLYDLDTGNMVKKIISSDVAAGDQFGHAVSIHGDNIVISAWKADPNGTDSGAVYVYKVSDSSEMKIVPSDGVDADNFGASVSVFENRIAVGAPFTDIYNSSNEIITADVGSAYIYSVLGVLEWKFSRSEDVSGIVFGSSLDLRAERVFVGAPGAFGFGAVYVHDLISGESPEVMTSPVTSAGARFGVSVAVNASRILIGSDLMDVTATNQGAAYLFSHGYEHKRTLLHPTPSSSDFMGGAVALNSNEAIVSVLQDDDNGSSSGAALTYPLIFGEINQLVIQPSISQGTFLLSWAASDSDDLFDIECSIDLNGWELLHSAVSDTQYVVSIQPSERQCFFRVRTAQ